MSIDGEKKTFVIKHTFTDVKNMRNNARHYGNKETHFNIPWSIYILPQDSTSMQFLRLECHKPRGKSDWSIEMTVNTKILTTTTGGYFVTNNEHILSQRLGLIAYHKTPAAPLADYLVNGNLIVECHVTINKMIGIEIPMEKLNCKSFDDESAKKFSDIVLKVKDQNFHVNKMYLASHSTYFESLLFGNFEESKQSEVELKDIEPYDFQKFLEVLYGIPDINENDVKDILSLADMYDAGLVVYHCEKFLIKDSKQTHKEKFFLAIQYKLNFLKKKCMAEFKNVEEIASIIPEDPLQLDHAVWKELLNLCVTFARNR